MHCMSCHFDIMYQYRWGHLLWHITRIPCALDSFEAQCRRVVHASLEQGIIHGLIPSNCIQILLSLKMRFVVELSDLLAERSADSVPVLASRCRMK